IDFKGTVKCSAAHTSESPPEIDLTVYPRGCVIAPRFLNNYTLTDLQGELRYAQNWVYLTQLRARHGPTVLGLEKGHVYCKPGGGFWAEIVDLWGNPLKPDADFLRALPGPLQKACQAIQLTDPVTLKTLLVLDLAPESVTPVIYWDGWLALQKSALRLGVD